MSELARAYERIARVFTSARDRSIGADVGRAWSARLPHGARVLDVGCGVGVPITDALVSEGFVVHGVDASPSLAAAWARRFPEMSIEVADVVTCRALDDTWDAIVRWGLVCLLPPDTQRLVLARIARALVPRGHLLFTALRQVLTWQDALTDVQSWSRGSWPPRPGLRARSSP